MSTRYLRRNRFGLTEDPVGRTIADPLLTITGVLIKDMPGGNRSLWLTTKHFDGSDGPEVMAALVKILDDDIGTLIAEGWLV